MRSTLVVIAAVLVWGAAEATVVLAGTYNFIEGRFGSYPVYSVSSSGLIGTFEIALISGYFLSDFELTFKALLASEPIAFVIVLSTALFPSFSLSSPDLFLVFFVLVFVFLTAYFLIGLVSSFCGCFLNDVMKRRNPYPANFHVLAVAIILDLTGILLAVMTPDHPTWIVTPIVFLIAASLVLTFYGRIHRQISIPRRPGSLIFTSLIAAGCALIALQFWSQLYSSCASNCSFQPTAVSQVIWALWGTMLPPGIILLDIALGGIGPGRAADGTKLYAPPSHLKS